MNEEKKGGTGMFAIDEKTLSQLSEHKDAAKLAEYGGVSGLANLLGSSLSEGIDPLAIGHASLDGRREAFGANQFEERKGKSFFKLLLSNLRDPTLILLMAAAAVSTIIGVAVKSQREQSGWSEGVAIWIAVLIVSMVGAGNDYQKDLQFAKLHAAKDHIEVKAMRGGEEVLVPNTDVVVGDLLVLDTGDKLVADGIVVQSHGLVVDEASLTGESEPLPKGREHPWVHSGTQVTEGSGTYLVTAVGVNSEWGKTMALVAGEAHDTPLQEALGTLAAAIGKVGLAVGILCFIVLMIRWMVQNKGFPLSEFASGPLNYFIFAVTIVVVAIPEGLPLAVTISLAYSMKKMMKDNNFVRVLAACETMGGATAICSDKTGTLTENRMTVIKGWFAGRLWEQPPTLAELPPNLVELLRKNIALNSKAFLVENDDKSVDFVGNRTECALLMMLREWGIGYKSLRDSAQDDVEHIYGFSSERKMASVLIRTGSGLRLYNKGAAEIVIDRCDAVIGASGEAMPLSDDARRDIQDAITCMASQGLRTLCLAVRDFPHPGELRDDFFDYPPEEHLTACCIVGIKDPVRKEVPDAVATCKRAGIFVRMVTGDNIHTAQHIARECGILSEDGIALEGPEFRKMSENELVPLLPRLQVLARSSPTDKFTLVSLLRKQGEVVAVTGDGTNDAPALKEADVGLAMGIAGTEVAKEAADIVIMDDNFNSIVKSVLWGRSVFSNLRKFLQFQLTVNGVALVIAFVAAVSNGETPLNVLQLLWVNLIMDSMAALALATEAPTPELLLEKPHGRNEALISPKMWKHMLTQTVYQLVVLFLVIYGAPAHIPTFSLPSGCLAYSNIDANGIDLRAVNVTGGSAQFNPIPISPPNSGLPNTAICHLGPCIDLCCNVNAQGFCVDNLAGVDGGHYYANEKPLCAFAGMKNGQEQCTILRVKNNKNGYCQGQASADNCPRVQQLQKLDNEADTQYTADVAHTQQRYNSIVFNAFIFLQVFNEFNSRKINDEYNVFKGLWQSKTFIYIILITVGFQLIIMFTAVRSFFKTTSISWEGWLYSLATGFASLPLALLVKFISRNCGSPWPRRWKRRKEEELEVEVAAISSAGRPSSPRMWWSKLHTSTSGTGSSDVETPSRNTSGMAA